MTSDLLIAFIALPAKRCCTCHEPKQLLAFCVDRSRQDGLSKRCRACDRSRALAYQRGKREAISTLALFGEVR